MGAGGGGIVAIYLLFELFYQLKKNYTDKANHDQSIYRLSLLLLTAFYFNVESTTTHRTVFIGMPLLVNYFDLCIVVLDLVCNQRML